MDIEPDHLLYLFIDIGVLLVPLLFSFHPQIRFYRHWKSFLVACGLVAIPFLVWDIAFTDSGVWGFNPRYLSGITLINLPIEEWLFFFCIPYACVFTFYCLNLLWKTARPGVTWFRVLQGASVVFLIIAIWHPEKAYTFMTCMLNAIVLGYLSWWERPKWLPLAIVAYGIVLPFFFLSNGLLTGSWIGEQVVWYHGNENLGVRMGTIPLEDMAYGFALILLNVTVFEHLRRKCGS